MQKDGVFLAGIFRGIAALAVIVLLSRMTMTSQADSLALQLTPRPTVNLTPAPLNTPTSTLAPTAAPATALPLPTLPPGLPTPPISVLPPPPIPPGNILGYHTVRQGETLFCIGRAYRVSPWAIASHNRLSYPYTLWVGQVLAIPNVPWTNVPQGPVCQRQFGGGGAPVQPAPAGCQANYVVQRGDTLFSIARRYGTTAWAIAAANNISNPNLIFVRQRLCIP